MTTLLKNYTADELAENLTPAGVSPSLARRIQAAVFRHDIFPDQLPEVSPKRLVEIRRHVEVPRLTLLNKVVSPKDGFARYAFRGDGEGVFEAVAIPLTPKGRLPRLVICVSSQVGCALGCVFCATGRMGFVRDLAAWEIVDQVLQLRRDARLPVAGVVFMGMGEPLLNYDDALKAADILREPCGAAIAAKAITFCTAGWVPGIRRFTAERRPYRLLASLTSADPAVRARLMPIENRHSTGELMEALRAYHVTTRRRVTLAWVMISGVNTREEDARRLAVLTRALPVKLDLIDVNDPTGRFRPPTPEELGIFRDALRRHLAAPVARRYSGGADIQAACGLLAGELA